MVLISGMSVKGNVSQLAVQADTILQGKHLSSQRVQVTRALHLLACSQAVSPDP